VELQIQKWRGSRPSCNNYRRRCCRCCYCSGTAVTSGTFRDSVGVTQNVTSNTSGPVGTFNQSGNGAAGGQRNKLSLETTANGPGRVWSVFIMQVISLVEQGEMQVMEELMNLDKLVKQDLVDLEAEAEEPNNGSSWRCLGVQDEINYRFLRVN
jgi:hypothetical protein